MEMLRSGNVIEIVESRMFWLRFIVVLSVMPMLENVLLIDTDDVRVVCE